MATRTKRSVSLPADLSDAVDEAAATEGATPSAWLADAARRKLMIQTGIREINEWSIENGGPPTQDEADEAEAFAKRIQSA